MPAAKKPNLAIDDIELPPKGSRYFVLDRPQGNLFWEVTLADSTVRLRSGSVGALGKTKENDRDKAESYIEKEIAKKIAAGYVEQTGEAVWIRGEGKKPMLMRVPIDKDEVRISFYNMFMNRLDLSSLTELTKLNSVNISGHKLVELDLSVLPKCKNLKKVWLHETGLKTIDLGPIPKCKKLEDLTVRTMKSIDLSPLGDSHSLKTISLMGNLHKTLDVSPLAKTPVEMIHFQHCPKLKKLDITPLVGHKTLKLITVDTHCTLVGEDRVGFEIRRFE